jgi:hypothetical protein
VFHVVGSSATYGVDYADWLLRVCSPPSRPTRYMDSAAAAAIERVREALQTGTIHPSLLTPGPSAKYA